MHCIHSFPYPISREVNIKDKLHFQPPIIPSVPHILYVTSRVDCEGFLLELQHNHIFRASKSPSKAPSSHAQRACRGAQFLLSFTCCRISLLYLSVTKSDSSDGMTGEHCSTFCVLAHIFIHGTYCWLTKIASLLTQPLRPVSSSIIFIQGIAMPLLWWMSASF